MDFTGSSHRFGRPQRVNATIEVDDVANLRRDLTLTAQQSLYELLVS